MTSRREFLATTGAGVLGLSAAQILGARPPDPAVAELIATMRNRLRQIRTFYIACELRADASGTGWSKEDRAFNTGTTELAWDGHVFAAIHHRPGFRVTEIERPSGFTQWIDYEAVHAPRRILYDGPRGGDHRIAFSIRQFLPLPLRNVSEDGDPVTVRGRSTRKLLASPRRFFVDDDARVQRLEHLHARTGATIETVDFDDFIFPTAVVPFPSVLISLRTGKAPLTTTCTTVEINAVPRRLPGVE